MTAPGLGHPAHPPHGDDRLDPLDPVDPARREATHHPAGRRPAALAVARPLLRAQLERRTIRVVLIAAAGTAAWLAWSPGTRFGLVGLYGGWRYAADRLFDVGLVPLAAVGALAGAAPRERRLDEFLHLAGVPRPRVVTAVAVVGAALAVVALAAFALGAGVGGWARAEAMGGSWWAGPDASGGGVADAMVDVRFLLGAALVGSLAALGGWVVRREGRAVALAVVVTAAELPEVSALLGRLPVTIDMLALSPIGAVRAVTLGDRGLAAPGFTRPTSPWPYALAVAGWCAVVVVAALPHPGRARPIGSPVVVRWVGVVSVVAATLAFGAVVPGRAAEALPWRWQRSWRVAEAQGSSSPQVVDRYLAAVRAGAAAGPEELPVGADAVAPAVVDSLRRADRVDRQPVATMAGPDHVLVRLHFADPIVSGRASFHDYLVRFTLRPDADQRWGIVGAEGPVADTPAGDGGGGR